jgi:hypothetical protein
MNAGCSVQCCTVNTTYLPYVYLWKLNISKFCLWSLEFTGKMSIVWGVVPLCEININLRLPKER